MNQKSTIACCATVLALGLAGPAEAALLSRLGGQAYYDNVLDITWLTNANLADTTTFGVGDIQSDGSMVFNTASFSWIPAMNAAGHLGFNDWRLPTFSPIKDSTFNFDFSNNATTDFGFADAAGWVDGLGRPVSELGHMFYVNLGNLGRCTPDNADPGSCVSQAGADLVEGPFDNLQSGGYWFGLGSDVFPDNPAALLFSTGSQQQLDSENDLFAWPVRSGDVVPPIPLPGGLWLLGTGLGLLGAGLRKRRSGGNGGVAPAGACRTPGGRRLRCERPA